MTTGEMTVKSDPEPRAADVRRIHLTPLLGAHDEGPLSYLLVIDSFTILLDCGWDDRLQLETIQPILECGPLLPPVHSCAYPYHSTHTAP
jgi:hypothetical protein